MIIPLWLRAAVAAAILAALVGLAWFIHHTIWKSGYDAHKQEVMEAEKEAIAKRLAENADLAMAQEAERVKLQKGFENEIKSMRTRIANADRLRIPSNCGGPAGTTEGKTASGSDGGDTGTRMVSEATQRDFDALEERVEEVFASSVTSEPCLPSF
jgi:hypothetical protein